MNLKLTILCGSLLCVHASYSSEQSSIIKYASYLVYHRQNKITGGVPIKSKKVTFYTYLGDPLATYEHNHYFATMKNKLDPYAPKPQPLFFEIAYLKKPVKTFDRLQPAGYYIIFYDKNDNPILTARHSGLALPSLADIRQFSNLLDLTNILNEES